MKSKMKMRFLSFRVTEEEYQAIEEIALEQGETPNGWARKKIVKEAQQGTIVNDEDQILYEQLARLGYLLDHGFGILFSQVNQDRKADEEWMRRVRESKHIASMLVKDMFNRK